MVGERNRSRIVRTTQPETFDGDTTPKVLRVQRQLQLRCSNPEENLARSEVEIPNEPEKASLHDKAGPLNHSTTANRTVS